MSGPRINKSRQSLIFFIVNKNNFLALNNGALNNANMAIYIILRHPVIILDTELTNPDNLTNDLLIPKLLIVS